MAWYTKYLSIYEKPINQVSSSILQEIARKLENKRDEQPLVSVVIIAHNEEKTILSCLWSLADNQCSYPIEIIVVNNCSTDRTTQVLNSVKANYLNELKKGPGHARQCGLDHARGMYYLSIDADTIYPPHYIQTMVDQLKKEGIMVVTGFWNFIPSERNGRFTLFIYESLRNLYLRLQSIKRPELVVRGAISGYRIKEARKYGYRTDILRGEDGSLALSLKNEGKIKLVTSRKVYVMTDDAVIASEGSLLKSLFMRFKRVVCGISALFIKKEKYKDEESNLIKP